MLFTSWLFQHVVPPVIPFALGSLGFLTNFDYSNHQKVLDSAINDGVRVNLRMRFTATIYRAVNKDEEEERRRCVRSGETGQIFMETLRSTGWQAIESGNTPIPPSNANSYHCGGRDRELAFSITRPAESFEVLNDLVVDRGPSPYVSLLELFGDEHHMTTVQADGLCVATPTGSTAYSVSIELENETMTSMFDCACTAVRRRLPRPSRNPYSPHHTDMSAHTLLPADAIARQYGVAHMCAL